MREGNYDSIGKDKMSVQAKIIEELSDERSRHSTGSSILVSWSVV